MVSPPLTAVGLVFTHVRPLAGLHNDGSFSVAHLVSSYIDFAPLHSIASAVKTKSLQWFERVVNAHRDRIPPVLLDHRLCCAGAKAVSLGAPSIIGCVIKMLGERMPRAFGLPLASGIGDLELVNQFVAGCTAVEKVEAALAAAEQGHLEALQCLVGLLRRPLDDYSCRRLWYSALAGGYRSCMVWVYSQRIEELDREIVISTRAIERDDVDSMRWQVAMTVSPEWAEDALLESKGHVPVLALLLDEYKYSPRLSDFIDALAGACKSGSIDAMEFLWQRRTQCYGGVGRALSELFWTEDEDEDDERPSVLEAAVRSGRMDVFRWVESKMSSKIDLKKISERTIARVAGDGHLDMLKFLHEQGALVNTSKVMEAAARGGQLGVCKWLVEMRLFNGSFQDVLSNVLSHGSVCKGEELTAEDRARQRVYTWLWDQIDNSIKQTCPSRLMGQAATHGVTKIIREMHGQVPEYVNSISLTNAIRNGQLEVVRYLICHGLSVAYDDFGVCIGSGYLEMLMLLHDSVGRPWDIDILEYLLAEAAKKKDAFPIIHSWLLDKLHERQATEA